jgi:AcrR family transcriptional regulator
MGNKRLALDRLQKIAAEAFTQRSFEKVSIAQIAAKARCSTATIYEIYGSKAELYVQVRRRATLASHPPAPRRIEGLTALESLLNFAVERFLYLSNVPPTNYVVPEEVDRSQMAPATKAAVRRNNPLCGARDLVADSQAAGLLRRGDASAVAYTICAAIGFEASSFQRVLPECAPIDMRPIIEVVFRCFVTRAGQRQLARFVRTLPKREGGDEYPTMLSALSPKASSAPASQAQPDAR